MYIGLYTGVYKVRWIRESQVNHDQLYLYVYIKTINGEKRANDNSVVILQFLLTF